MCRKLQVTIILVITFFLLASSPVFSSGQQEGAATGGEAEAVTLKIWVPSFGDSLKKAFVEISGKFEDQNPNISVELTETPFTEHFKKLGLALGTGRGPDAYRVTEIWTYVEAGFALPMPDDIAASTRQDLYDHWADEATYDGKMYAVFDEAGPRMLVFNRAMWEEAGISESPATWGELTEYAKKLTVYDGDELMRPGLNLSQNVGPAYTCAFAPVFRGAGGQWSDASYKKVLFNDESGRRALQWWADLTFKHNVSSPNFSHDSFLLEQSAMRFDGPWIVNQAKTQAPDLADDVGMGMVPPPEKGMDPVLQDAPWKWMVNKESENPEAAWQFLNFYAREWANNYAAEHPCPIYYKTIADEKIAEYESKGEARTVAILKTAAASRRRPRYWRTYAVRFGSWIEKVLVGEASVEEALNNASKEIEQSIAEGGEL